MKHSLHTLLLSIALTCASVAAHADTVRAGVSSERLARVDALLDSYVNEGRVAGVVALVLRDGKPMYERAVGWIDKEAGRKMTLDAEFRIASQSKALTSVAILQLMEEGKLTVNDHAGKYIPTFEKTTVLSRAENSATTTVVSAKRPILIKDLLTHTAGINYGQQPEFAALYEPKGLGPAAGFGWYFADKDEPICTTMERLGTLPFQSQPGEAFVYGYNTDVLGCIVEKASGETLDAFIKSHILDPLGMKDTYFYLPREKQSRLAVVYGSDQDGKAVRQPEGARGQGHYVEGPRKSFSGGAGLVSTARDYATFLEALRNGGARGAVRILSPHAVQLMTTNQIGDLKSPRGLGFGYGFETPRQIWFERHGVGRLVGLGRRLRHLLSRRSGRTHDHRAHVPDDAQQHRSHRQVQGLYLPGARRLNFGQYSPARSR
jgi:CubicO group peptidase (beta-lactamase class C family)